MIVTLTNESFETVHVDLGIGATERISANQELTETDEWVYTDNDLTAKDHSYFLHLTTEKIAVLELGVPSSTGLRTSYRLLNNSQAITWLKLNNYPNAERMILGFGSSPS